MPSRRTLRASRLWHRRMIPIWPLALKCAEGVDQEASDFVIGCGGRVEKAQWNKVSGRGCGTAPYFIRVDGIRVCREVCFVLAVLFFLSTRRRNGRTGGMPSEYGLRTYSVRGLRCRSPE